MELNISDVEFKEAIKKISERLKNMVDCQLAEILLMKERAETLYASGYNVEDYYTRIFNGESAKDAFYGFNEAWEELNNIKPKEPTIDMLKKQIKYSKSPLEVKMLNKKLNQIYKDVKRR